MMKKLIFGIFGLILVNSIIAEEIDVTTKTESVTIYHLGALVSRTADVELKVGVNELNFKNLSSKIILSTLKIKNRGVTILNKTVVKKLTSEQFNQLLDKKEALQNQLSLLESKYTDVGFVSEVTDLEIMINFYSNKILEIKRNLRKVVRDIDGAKKLEDIKLDNENAAILKITVSIQRPLDGKLELQYIVGGISWLPSYEISVNNSADKTIEIKYLAKVMSQTGEDWDDVTINLSSSFPLESPTSLPKADKPWVVDGRSSSLNQQSSTEVNNPILKQQQQIAILEGVEYQALQVPSFLKQRTLKELYSIKSNSTVFSFPIMKVNLPAEYYYYGFPSIDPEVFLVAEIIGWDTLGFVDGVANITFNNNDVGKSVIKFSESIDTLLLPIGKDNSVFMKRVEMADQKYFKAKRVSKKWITTFAYEYELKNNNSFPIQFKLIDQVPISQSKSAKVEIEKSSNGSLNKEIGEIVWQLGLKPGQAVNKELVYSIETDSHVNFFNSFDREDSERGRKKYRAIYAPAML